MAVESYADDEYAQVWDRGVAEGYQQALAIMWEMLDRQAEPRRTWLRAMYDTVRVKAPTAADLRDKHIRRSITAVPPLTVDLRCPDCSKVFATVQGCANHRVKAHGYKRSW